MLISDMSEPSQPVPLCHFMPDIALIVAMIIVGTILVIIMLVLVIYCRKKYNKSEYALPIPDAKLPTSVTPPESPTEKVDFFEAREVYDVLQNQKVHQNGDGPIARYQRQSSGGHSDTSATSATHLIRQTNPDAPIDEDEDEDEVFPLQFQNFHKKHPLRIHIPRRYMNHQDPAEGLLALQSPDSGIIAGSPGYSGTAGSLPLAEERSISNGKESMSDYLHMVEFGQGNNSLPNDQNASRLMSFDSGISYSDSSPDALMTPLTLSELLPFEGSKSDNEISIDGVSSRARKNESIKGLNEIVPLTDTIVMNVHGVLSEDDITDHNDTIANDAGLVPSNGKGKIDMSPVQHVTEGDIPTSNGDSDNPATPVLLDNPGYITSNAVDTSQSSSHDSNSTPLYVNGGTNQHYVNTVN
ncbi:uncharacterized protein [Ptychodera flava]|uniref:uncharacterized protein n=1 Tax=Ptychodera flava TaxID=63121 RepID=UPI003969F7D7